MVDPGRAGQGCPGCCTALPRLFCSICATGCAKGLIVQRDPGAGGVGGMVSRDLLRRVSPRPNSAARQSFAQICNCAHTGVENVGQSCASIAVYSPLAMRRLRRGALRHHRRPIPALDALKSLRSRQNTATTNTTPSAPAELDTAEATTSADRPCRPRRRAARSFIEVPRRLPAGAGSDLFPCSRLQRLVRPIIHWMDDSRAFRILRPPPEGHR